MVTGGGGFIGSHIVDALLSLGVDVGILDNFSTGVRPSPSQRGQVPVVHDGDIRDFEFVKKTVRGYGAVFHEAARVSVTRSVETPLETNEVNVTGTLNLLEGSRLASVSRFVYASSSSVYGETPTLPKEEGMTPSPVSPYAVSKLAAEQYCRQYASLIGLKTVSLRYFNVYGPRQRPGPYSGVIPRFREEISAGRRPTIFGDGTQSRDFTFVKDVVQANLLCLGSAVTGGEVFNVGAGRRSTIRLLAESMATLMGRPDLEPVYADPRKGDVMHSLADITRISVTLGYSPRYTLEEGLAETLSTGAAR